MLDKDRLAAAFDEWQRRYMESPDQFAREFETALERDKELREGKPLSYGRACAEYLRGLMEEMAANGEAPQPPRKPAA